MKKFYFLITGTLFTIASFAQESHLHIGLDLQTKYVWRGMEMMQENATPVLFPQINYQNQGLYAYVTGGTSLNGKYSELDFGVSYTYRWISVSVNDYYYPATVGLNDRYLNFAAKETGHWLEGVVTISPEKIPAYLTLSNFFYGADKNPDGKQAYSTYLEAGAHYDFSGHGRIFATVGAACNESCYNGYEHGFGVCNLGIGYTYGLQVFKDRILPLGVTYIVNPVREKAFINFSASLAF